MLTGVIKGAVNWELTGCSRFPVLFCCLLVFWTGIDSQFFMLITDAALPLSTSSTSYPDDSDDDEMIDLKSTAESFQAIGKKNHHSLPQYSWNRFHLDVSSRQHFQLMASNGAPWGHLFSDLLKTPLRC